MMQDYVVAEQSKENEEELRPGVVYEIDPQTIGECQFHNGRLDQYETIENLTGTNHNSWPVVLLAYAPDIPHLHNTAIDGRGRVEVAQEQQFPSIKVLYVPVKDVSEAQRLAVSKNCRNGVPYSIEEKRGCIANFNKQGISQSAIAKIMNLTQPTIHYHLKQMGILENLYPNEAEKVDCEEEPSGEEIDVHEDIDAEEECLEPNRSSSIEDQTESVKIIPFIEKGKVERKLVGLMTNLSKDDSDDWQINIINSLMQLVAELKNPTPATGPDECYDL